MENVCRGLCHVFMRDSVLLLEKYKMLVGIDTDGTSVNIAAVGLKGLVEGELEWVFWMWCLVHRQEMTLKDALKVTICDVIDKRLTMFTKSYQNMMQTGGSCFRFALMY